MSLKLPGNRLLSKSPKNERATAVKLDFKLCVLPTMAVRKVGSIPASRKASQSTLKNTVQNRGAVIVKGAVSKNFKAVLMFCDSLPGSLGKE